MITVKLQVTGTIESDIQSDRSHTVVVNHHVIEINRPAGEFEFTREAVSWGTSGGPGEERPFFDRIEIAGLNPERTYEHRLHVQEDGILVHATDPTQFRTGIIDSDGDILPASKLGLVITGLQVDILSQYQTP